MVVSLGPTSKYLGPREKMYRKCRYVWSASSATSLRTKLREQPGWTTSRWCRNRRSIPSHEVLASRYLRVGRFWGGGAWRGRGLGARCHGNGRGIALPGLVYLDLFQPRRTACFFTPAAAARGAVDPCIGAVVFSWDRFCLQHADGIAIAPGRPNRALSRGASLSNSRGLAGFRVVRNVFRFSGQPLRHPPTPDVERQALLVSRDTLRRAPFWAVRESESLCRICRVDSAACTHSPRLGPGTAGALARCRIVRGSSHRGALPLCVAGRHREFRR